MRHARTVAGSQLCERTLDAAIWRSAATGLALWSITLGLIAVPQVGNRAPAIAAMHLLTAAFGLLTSQADRARPEVRLAFLVLLAATLVLDVTKAIGFFALTGLDFNLTAIAAILTLVGYSVNDKVVVYDRMRENMRLYKSMPLREIIDRSINETLARSLYTNATAFLALLPMAIWGGSAVESFAIPMVFGILVAGASSIFIAAPILLFLGDWRRRHAKPVANDGKQADGTSGKDNKQIPAAE